MQNNDNCVSVRLPDVVDHFGNPVYAVVPKEYADIVRGIATRRTESLDSYNMTYESNLIDSYGNRIILKSSEQLERVGKRASEFASRCIEANANECQGEWSEEDQVRFRETLKKVFPDCV